MKRSFFSSRRLCCRRIALTAANAHTPPPRRRSATARRRRRTRTSSNGSRGAALRAALKRPADIVPAPAGACPKTVLTPTSGGRPFAVAMTGNAETPAGDPVATGTAPVPPARRAGTGLLPDRGKNLPPAVAAHIHRGGAGVGGPGGRPADDAERGRHLERLRDRGTAAGQGDPRRAGVVLRQRPHGRVPGRGDPRAADRHVDGVASGRSTRST